MGRAGPLMMSSNRALRNSGRLLLVPVVAVTAFFFHIFVSGAAFQHQGGTRTDVSGASTSRLTGSSGGRGRGRSSKAGSRALPEFIFGIEVASLPTHFLVALIPALALEAGLSKPVQNYLQELGFANPKALLPGFDETVSVERAFDPINKPSVAGSSALARIVPQVQSLMHRTHGPVLALNAVSAAALFYDTYLVPQGYRSLSLPIEPFVLTALGLAFLLIQRVTQASQRFSLAKQLWGDVLNVSRDLAQQASQWASTREGFVEYARWLPAFTASMMCHLRDADEQELEKELRGAAGLDEDAGPDSISLSEEDIQSVMSRPEGWSAPQFVLHILRDKTKTLGLNDEERILMEANTTRLINDLGACEDIAGSVGPQGAAQYTSRFLLGWLSVLPFALEAKLGLWTVFGEQLLAVGLLGIQDTGKQMEDPFSTLPLKQITAKIALEANVLKSNVAALDGGAEELLGLPLQQEEAEQSTEVASVPSTPRAAPLEISEVRVPVEITSEIVQPSAAVAQAPQSGTASLRMDFREYLGATAISESDLNDAAGVRGWLQERRLDKYFNIFVDEGYDDLTIFRDADDDEIESLIAHCCMPRGHVRHFKRGIQKLRTDGVVKLERQLLEETEMQLRGQLVPA